MEGKPARPVSGRSMSSIRRYDLLKLEFDWCNVRTCDFVSHIVTYAESVVFGFAG